MPRGVTLFQRRDAMDAHIGSRSSPTCNGTLTCAGPPALSSRFQSSAALR
jgi:hypothetical protein